MLMNNKLLAVSLLSWLMAQILKTIINFLHCKKLDYNRLFQSEDMPSAHSALVCALTSSIALKHGISSDYFALALSFSIIVMYDALGVRRESGKHAKA